MKVLPQKKKLPTHHFAIEFRNFQIISWLHNGNSSILFFFHKGIVIAVWIIEPEDFSFLEKGEGTPANRPVIPGIAPYIWGIK